ncbi:hypothetical protein ACFL1N_01950 [Thermodesulfobacteriota bacterium]
MSESKFAKNIVTEDLMPPFPEPVLKMLDKQEKEGKYLDRTLMFGINDSIVKGSFFSGCEWLWELKDGKPFQIEAAHSHDFDEVIGLIGSRRENPRELGGEVEFWIEDEKHILTKSCLMYIPKGTMHCPLIINRIDSPIFLYEAGNDTFYKRNISEQE